MVDSNKTCEDCNSPIIGRSDKRFCNDHCRNNFHGKKNRDWNNYMRNVNHILRRNRRILLNLYSNNELIISKEKLVILGFQLKYCTFIEIELQIRVYYDYAIQQHAEGKYRIIYKEERELLQTG